MIYKAENIDTDKFLKALDNVEKYNREKEIREKISIEKYYQGYQEALDSVRQMFYCSNYEKSEVKDEQSR